MRFLLILVVNLLGVLWTALRNLAWLLARRPRPDYVRIVLEGAPPLLVRRLWTRTVPGEKPRSREELSRMLDAIQASPVRGVILRVEGLGLGMAAIGEVRERVARLRAAGKRVVFHADAAGGREYALMCAGDTVWLTPEGRLDLTGVRAELTTLGAALGKVGLSAQVIRRGRYKSAGEMFTNEESSPENKEQIGELLDALYGDLVGAIAAGRAMEEAKVRALVDQGPFSARGAAEAGLVDGLCWEDEVVERLAEPGQDKPRVGTFAHLIASRPAPLRWRPLRRPPAIARVPVVGVIKTGKSRGLPAFGAATGAESTVRALDRAARSPRVRAVVLHVDSRGGSALASDLIWRAVRRCAAKKPVVAWLEDVAASGGYYVAAGASKILSAPTCITGSIGVIAGKVELSELLSRVGVRRELMVRGANAGIWSWSRPFSETERAALEREIGDTYDTFLARVAEGRGMPREKAEAAAEGRVFTGTKALGLGLVDALGGFEDAVAGARELARIPAGVVTELVDLGPRAMGPLMALRRALASASWTEELLGGAGTELGGRVFAVWPWDVSV